MSSGFTLRAVLSQVLSSLLLTLPVSQLRAEAPLPIGRDGLPGGRHAVLATERMAPLVAGGAVALAHTESVLASSDRHARLAGDVFAALAAHPAVLVSASVGARVDVHRGERDDRGVATSSALAARARHALLDDTLHVAGEMRTVFPPSETPGRGFRAVSPELRAFATYLAYSSTFSLNLGYRFDRSAHALADPNAISDEGLLSASASSSDALLLAAAASRVWLDGTWMLEWSYDLGLGDRAPRASQSAMRLEGSFQRMATESLAWGVHLGVSPSARPQVTTSPLVRIEPRVWAGASVAFVFDTRAPKPAPVTVVDSAAPPVSEPKPPPAVAEPAEPALPPGQIRGRVRSLRGPALRAEIEVSPLQMHAESQADGSFAIDVAPGDYAVTVRAKGHVPQTRTATVEQNGVTILVIDLERSRP
jgi:hypothetical protein